MQMSDVWRLVHLARLARHGGYPLRMPSDFPRTLRVALFRATTAACVDALDHDARWERFSPNFNMCASLAPWASNHSAEWFNWTALALTWWSQWQSQCRHVQP